MRALFIIAQHDFQDHELMDSKEVLEDAGIGCDVASITTDAANGNLGMIMMPDLEVKHADAKDYDIIIVIGGPGAPQLAKHKEVISLLQEAKKRDKKLAAICIAPIILAKAGVLEGKKATVFETPESVKILQEGKAIYTPKAVVVDDKLVTANGPAAAREFGRKITEMLRA